MLSKLVDLKALKIKKEEEWEVKVDVNQILKEVEDVNIRKGGMLLKIS